LAAGGGWWRLGPPASSSATNAALAAPLNAILTVDGVAGGGCRCEAQAELEAARGRVGALQALLERTAG
jgi:hypothetical protein